MSTARFRVLSGSCLLVALGLATTPAVQRPHSGTPEPVTFPRPTEINAEQDEERVARQREAWIDSLHNAAPGTDWHEIERQNWTTLLKARQLEPATLAASWSEVGSYNLAGRTHQSVYDATTHNLYIGAALGGVWRGSFNADAPDPANMGWTPLSDNIYGGARGMVLLSGSPPTILKTHSGFFTGEIHRSTNGGANWTVVATTTDPVKKIVKLGGASTVVFALARSYTSPPKGTLYRSTDGGVTFQSIRTFVGFEPDIWTSRTGTGPLYLLTDLHIETSTNQGTSWSIAGTLPYPAATRSILTGSEAGSPRLYAVAMLTDSSGQQLFRSDNGGLTWSSKGALAQGVFDNVAFAASTINADLVLYGGLDCWRSLDGGTSFARINSWTDYYGAPATRLHADIPAIDFVPLSGGREALFISTDAGTYFSADGGATVSNLSLQGLRIGQVYSTRSLTTDANRTSVGAQDQGFQVRRVGTNQFDQVISGDYGNLTTGNALDLVFAVYPGFVLAVERVGSSNYVYTQDFPAGEQNMWMAPLAADPAHPRVVYLGATHLYRYELSPGGGWSVTQLPFNFQTVANEVVSAIGIAPSDPSRWYVATNAGHLYFSTNAGSSWTPSLFTTVPAPQYLTGLGIAVDPTNAMRVAIGGSGYSNSGVYLSQDGGATFAPLGVGQPLTLVYGLAWGSGSPRDLYAGTETGAWKYSGATGTWASILQSPAPMTTYWSVEYGDGRMRYGTYGRGVWDYVVCAAPDEVAGVVFSAAPNKNTMTWGAIAGATRYDVVRGSLGQLPAGPGGADESCFDNLAVASFADATVPAGGFYYLVRAQGACGSGTFGAGHVNPGIGSNGPARLTTTCP